MIAVIVSDAHVTSVRSLATLESILRSCDRGVAVVSLSGHAGDEMTADKRGQDEQSAEDGQFRWTVVPCQRGDSDQRSECDQGGGENTVEAAGLEPLIDPG